MPTTNDDVIARIDALETTLLAQFSSLETALLSQFDNLETKVLNVSNKIDALGQNLSDSVFEKDSYKSPTLSWCRNLGNSNLNWAGQSFSSNGEYYLSKIQMSMGRYESPGDVTLEIYYAGEDNKPIGDVLATVIVPEAMIPVIAPEFGILPEWIDFEFESPILLFANEYGYVFVIHASNLSETNKLQFEVGNSAGDSEYDGGNFLSSDDGGQNWTVWTDRDALFKLFTDSPTRLLLKPKINFSRLG